jgi:hypothetical protein
MENTKPLRKVRNADSLVIDTGPLADTRKQSCDFCYRRRIKCDGEKPLCSNCIAYGTDCTYTAPSRKSAPKKRRRNSSQASDDGGIETQSRLTRLESLFEQVTDRLDVVERRSTDEFSLPFEESSQSITVTPTTTRTRSDSSAFRSMYLPPQEQVMSAIHTYLQDFNAVLPLFHTSILVRTVRACYDSGPSQRDPVAWAAIYVVLGLATRHGLVTSHEIPSAASCLSRAESVLSKVVLGDVQLLNIQVLVGLVMLLQASQDLKPALVLIGTTLRLAHSIGLHDRAHSEHLDSAHAKQRACVFWLAYILDKNLSMRARQPSVQIDDDIDLGLPSQTVLQCAEDIHETGEEDDDDDASGVIATTDGAIRMNYFTARIHLATIEGGVYDYLHSTRARRRSPEERSHAVRSLASALEQWKISIPHEFSAAESPRNVPPSTIRFLGIMYAASLACATQINQAWAWDNDWMTSVRTYGRQGIQPILPPTWDALVGEARDLLILYETIGEIGTSNFW